MIYEIRTYDLKPRSVPEFERRVAEKLKEGRQTYSPLFGFWHTEAGPLNQVVHIWPYDDPNQRLEVRAKSVADGIWPPPVGEFIDHMHAAVYLPAPFMEARGAAQLGPLYEMRIYTYAVGDIPRVIEKWGEHVGERQKYSPLVGAWYSDVGDLNVWIHMWAYSSFEERLKIRAETREKGVWPPPGGIAPLRQESKLLTPFSFSPLQ